MFEVRKSVRFSAAHSLRDYEGPCARNHGHNYKVEAVVRGNKLDNARMLIDFYDLDRLVSPVIERLDHRNLNEVPPFDEINPTAEAVAAWIFGELKPKIEEHTGGRATLAAVELWETPNSRVTYSE